MDGENARPFAGKLSSVASATSTATAASAAVHTARLAFTDISNAAPLRTNLGGLKPTTAAPAPTTTSTYIPTTTTTNATARPLTSRTSVFTSASALPAPQPTISVAAPAPSIVASSSVSDVSLSPHMDLADRHDAHEVPELAQDIFEFYKRIETEKLPAADYMRRQSDINEKMRAILVDWLIEVHYKFKLRPETLYLTVELLLLSVPTCLYPF